MAKLATRTSPGFVAVQRAEDYLRHQITGGFYQPGSRVSDARVASVLDIGRTAVREAIQRLNKEGLITVILNRGSFVVELDPDEVGELFELREALETHAVRLAALRASPERLHSLQEMLVVSRLAVVKHGGQYPAQLDFHERVVGLCGNQEIIRECREVSNRIRVARLRSGSRPARADEALEEHQLVVTALSERNPVKAADAMRDHLNRAHQSFLKASGGSSADTAKEFVEAVPR
jgi:DNA-binding GntR family transcriptional regulator